MKMVMATHHQVIYNKTVDTIIVSGEKTFAVTSCISNALERMQAEKVVFSTDTKQMRIENFYRTCGQAQQIRVYKSYCDIK